jgi:hypothetical protein
LGYPIRRSGVPIPLLPNKNEKQEKEKIVNFFIFEKFSAMKIGGVFGSEIKNFG